MADHVTETEIRDQPGAIEAMMNELERRRDDLADRLASSATVALVGCGSSHYLGRAGATMLNESDRADVAPAGEVLLGTDGVSDHQVDLILPISRSGSTTETVRATKQLLEIHPDATVVGFTCHEDSQLYEMADVPILSPQGAEESVVMTKAFSSLLVALEYLSQLRSDVGNPRDQLEGYSADSESVLQPSAKLASKLATERDFRNSVFLGSGPLYAVASEAMLKMEEMTLSWTKAYHALEFRHGPRSIAEDDTLVTLFVPGSGDPLYADLVDDVRSQGSEVVVIGQPAGLEGIDADHELELPSRETPRYALYAPFFQFLGFYTAQERGLDPDDPRHLSQVVEF